MFRELHNTIAWRQDRITLYGRSIPLPRLQAWYGAGAKPYAYSGITMQARPWTPALLHIKGRVEAAAGAHFTNALLNLYRHGRDSVDWHSDDEAALGQNPVIASLSLGAARRFQMRHKKRKELPAVELQLTHGSLLLMQGATQHHWRHRLPKVSARGGEVGARINLTFRALR